MNNGYQPKVALFTPPPFCKSLSKDIKKIKCKVCGKKFEPQIENHYTATEDKGLNGFFSGSQSYDCFDCPACGSQNAVTKRFDKYDGLSAAESAEE